MTRGVLAVVCGCQVGTNEDLVQFLSRRCAAFCLRITLADKRSVNVRLRF